jgi:hypothetical protein
MVRRNGKLFSPYSYKGLDDDFDTDNGFSGKIQFGIAVRDSQVADVSGSNAFESDNDANGSSLTPQTSATFSNMTIIGPINSSAPGSINIVPECFTDQKKFFNLCIQLCIHRIPCRFIY